MCGGKKKSCYDWGYFDFFLYEFGAETCAARSGMLQIGGVQSFRAGGSREHGERRGRDSGVMLVKVH